MIERGQLVAWRSAKAPKCAKPPDEPPEPRSRKSLKSVVPLGRENLMVQRERRLACGCGRYCFSNRQLRYDEVTNVKGKMTMSMVAQQRDVVLVPEDPRGGRYHGSSPRANVPRVDEYRTRNLWRSDDAGRKSPVW